MRVLLSYDLKLVQAILVDLKLRVITSVAHIDQPGISIDPGKHIFNQLVLLIQCTRSHVLGFCRPKQKEGEFVTVPIVELRSFVCVFVFMGPGAGRRIMIMQALMPHKTTRDHHYRVL